MKPQFLIAAPHSGAGKTTVTLGMIRALKTRGFLVQPFKCGPDYLDPKLHTIASGRESINLDRFMMDDAHLESLYGKYGASADVLITEGVMGLFDGSVKMEGSSADLALHLQLPVILVVNAKAMAYSVAALLLGFKLLRPELKIAGVIFNFVAHESHYNILKVAAADAGITALGYLPPNADIQMPSRHLGLKTDAGIDHDSIIEMAAAHIEKHVNLDELLSITAAPFVPAVLSPPATAENPLRILVARDEAFSFIYPENIAALSALGGISYFSPLTDAILPPADLIYLPGGYPELYLKELSSNTLLISQLQEYHRSGGKFLAECGGMMYMGQSITDETGNIFPMTGILNIATGLQHKKLSLGYKRVKTGQTEIWGHEFHYSHFIEVPEQDTAIEVWNARGESLATPVFKTENILASYLHFYFGNNIQAVKDLLFS